MPINRSDAKSKSLSGVAQFQAILHEQRKKRWTGQQTGKWERRSKKSEIYIWYNVINRDSASNERIIWSVAEFHGKNFELGNKEEHLPWSSLLSTFYLRQRNLVRWNIQTTNECRCGEKAMVWYVLSSCRLGLDRYTWRHNQVLGVLSGALKEKLDEYNRGEYPKGEKRGRRKKNIKPGFQKEVYDTDEM